MGSVGDWYDHALAESIFASLECGLLARTRLRAHLEARSALFDYIEVFDDRRRRHSVLGYLPPDAFEKRRFTETPVSPSRPLLTKTGQLQDLIVASLARD